ncbi:MAG: toxin-activating lysine-acyltransferase [Marinibacterium sp.]|nr:toxin-activating lysine-acyltransferase [Marinibacterium sp.]
MDTVEADTFKMDAPEDRAGGNFPNEKQLMAYGELSFLFLRSSTHKNVTATGLLKSIAPATDTGQFAILRQGKFPRACCTWAFFSEEAEARYLAGEPVTVDDWTSGDRAWIMDIVAPYGKGTGGRMLSWFRDTLPETHKTVGILRPFSRDRIRVYSAIRKPDGGWSFKTRYISWDDKAKEV